MNIQQEHLEGVTLNGRFLIQEKLNQGCHGMIYKVVDLLDQSLPLIVKIQQDDKLYEREKEFLSTATQSQYKGFPKLIASGCFYRRRNKLLGKFKVNENKQKIA
jgi:hypothetical protein